MSAASELARYKTLLRVHLDSHRMVHDCDDWVTVRGLAAMCDDCSMSVSERISAMSELYRRYRGEVVKGDGSDDDEKVEDD